MHGYGYLYRQSRQLARRVSRLGIGTYPTPISAVRTRHGQLFVKHDDRAHARYAGNKLRKLEFLLADAVARQCRYVATFGAAGSNHALATALHARALGLQPIAFLSRQAATSRVATTLACHRRIGTTLIYAAPDDSGHAAVRETLLSLGKRVAVVPMGGSSWLGALGFIAAAAELREQIEANILPTPSRIVIPLGTMGSVIGLAMGLHLSELPTRVHAVRVVNESIANDDRLVAVGERWREHIEIIDPDIKLAGWQRRVTVDHAQFGQGYARATDASEDARRIAAEDASLELENTYSAKAFAGWLAHDTMADDRTLFWNTFDPRTPALPSYGQATTTVPNELAYLES
ncbi:MAG: pyridoxal-phosphate dependent enzyme [Pseudomonadota bacterium]